MKYLVSSFFVGVACLCCEASGMEQEEAFYRGLYSGDVASKHARTYIYPCKFPTNNGGHFVSAITVDMGNGNYPSSEDMLTQLKSLVDGGPRVIWSGSFRFCRQPGCSIPTINSVVSFYSVYNEGTYFEPTEDQRAVRRTSCRYHHGKVDHFEWYSGRVLNGWVLEDKREGYLHSSDGEPAVYTKNRRSGWKGEGSVTQIGNYGSASNSMRVRALSMDEFLTGIGRSQGHVGYIRNSGKRFAPWSSLWGIERGENFVASVLKEFQRPEYSEGR